MIPTLVMATAVGLSPAVPQDEPGRIQGRILDAVSRTPLAGAVIVIEPAEWGVLSRPRGDVAQLAARTTESAGDGTYTFGGLAPGPYRLRVERIGYRPQQVDVRLSRGGLPRLSVGLEVEPIRLEPLAVSTDAPALGRQNVRRESPSAAVRSALDVARARFVETDTRLLTAGEIGAAASFPEPDLLRALQAAPGMSTRDDYSAELWTRGSPWGHTRVYLDDLPVFEPFFAGGTLTALAPAAAGAVFLHPGARPVSVGEGAAGVVRLRSRPAESAEGLPLLAELGLGTAHALTEHRFLSNRAGILVSGRRSWFDRIWNTFVDDGFDPEGPFDYRAGSSLWRLDAALGDDLLLEGSVYRGGDALGGNAAALIAESQGEWGSALEQLALSWSRPGRGYRVLLGHSRYEAEVARTDAGGIEPVDPDVVVLQEGRTDIGYARIGFESAPTRGLGVSFGAEVVRQTLAAAGVARAAASGSRLAAVGAGSLGAEDASALNASVWASHRARPLPWLEIEGGLRADGGPSVPNWESLRVAPHLAVRATLDSGVTLSLAGRRSMQLLQQIDAAGTPFGAGQTFGHAWTLAGTDTPLLTTDVFTAGVERPVGWSTWISGHLWFRHTSGMTVRNPDVGAVLVAPVAWTAGENRAFGVELLARRPIGPVTGHLSYSWLRSRDEASGRRYPSPAERTHAVSAVLHWAVGAGLNASAAFRAHSGAPFTRVLDDPCLDDLGRTDACAAPGPYQLRGAAGAARGPSYHSLDVGLDWVRRRSTWGWGVSARLRNALGIDNFGGYRGTDCQSEVDRGRCIGGMGGIDRFQRLIGFPLPTVGLRVWF